MRWDIPVDRGEMSLLRCTGHNAQKAIMKKCDQTRCDSDREWNNRVDVLAEIDGRVK